MRFLIPFTVALLALSWSPPVHGQVEVDVSMNASPLQLSVDDTLSLEVRIQVSGGKLEDVKLPDLSAFEIVAQQTSKPMQFSFSFGSGSGSRVQSTSTTVHAFRLRPLKAGTFRLNAAVAKVDGKAYRSTPIVVRVTGSSNAQATDGDDPAENPPAPGEDSELTGAKYDDRAFIRTIVDNPNPYVGEQINVTVRLYTRLGQGIGQIIPTKPDMNGFWVQDLPQTRAARGTANVRGKTFRTYDVFRFAAFPLRDGKLRIGSARVSFDTGGFGFFSSGNTIRRTGIVTAIDVRPRPEPSTPTAVTGKYSIQSNVHPVNVTTGNATTIRVTAQGVGRIESLDLKLPEIEGLRVLQPSIKDRSRTQGVVVSGSRTWEWIAIPQAPGTYVIPSIGIRFFDPETETYGVAKTQPMRVQATGAARPGTTTAVPPGVKQAPTPEVRFGPIRRQSELQRRVEPLRLQPWFRGALLAPPTLFAFALLFLAWNRRRRRQEDTPEAAVGRALEQASKEINADNPRGFYDQVVDALRTALDERLGRASSGMTQRELRDALRAQGFDDDLVDRIAGELDGADFARFASAGTNKDEMEHCLQRTRTLLERITAVAAFLLCFVVAGVAAPAAADSIQSSFDKANEAASRGQNQVALAGYGKLLGAGVDDPDVHFNFASVWAEAGNYPRAIYHFEKTLALRPSDEAAERDLRRAERLLENQRAEREGEATIRKRESVGQAVYGGFAENTLALLLLVSNAVLFLTLAWLLLSGKRRGWVAAISMIAAAGLIVAAIGLGVKSGAFSDGELAVVLDERLPLHEGPDASTRVRGFGRGADRCRILDREGDFVRIRLAGDGAEGWAKANSVGGLSPGGLSR